MTTSIAAETRRRRRARPPAQRRTAVADLREALLAQLKATTGIRFPDRYWWDHPVEFFRRILGVEPWSKQIEIIEAVRDHDRVAVRSGHKVSKSHSAAGIAACYYCSFADARVVMSSTTARQVDQILWRELRMMRARAGRCTLCKEADPDGRRIPRPCPHSAIIEGEMGALARTGLKSQDFREIVGFTAREAEAVAGVSGRHLLYIIDEASGVPDEIFEAVEGNRAGGARIVLFSNPTRTSGEFFDAFHDKAEFYHGIQVSSEETPNVLSGEKVIPGLATRTWIEEKRREWGEESPMYKVRVRGEFALGEDGKIFSVHAIAEAEDRWEDTPETGRLFIGVDPAGESGMGDEAAFAARRGLKLLGLHTERGLSEAEHLVRVLGVIEEHGIRRETPVVVLDREGAVGAKVYAHFQGYLEEHPYAFELVTVRASDRAVRQPYIYDRMRDELVANLESWVRDGGAIVEDTKLAAEMHVFVWEQHVNGRLKLMPRKKDLRKSSGLGRSPDRFDALALACWEPLALRAGDDLPPSVQRDADDDDGPWGAMDPYAGGIDPYGGG